jgi:hypothetical protein
MNSGSFSSKQESPKMENKDQSTIEQKASFMPFLASAGSVG